MSNSNAQKDYYEILGAHEGTTARELERLYKRRAAQSHPDRGGSEEEMKSLNEAYGVLRNQEARKTYDAQRARPDAPVIPITTPTAQDVGLLGRGLSSFLCLIIGLFLFVLVRSQWIFFLWPMAILAFLVILLGVVMARGTMRAFNSSLPATNPFRRYTRIQEVTFWCVVAACCYGVYLLMTRL